MINLSATFIRIMYLEMKLKQEPAQAFMAGR